MYVARYSPVQERRQVKRYTKIDAELVVDPREVLEARPRTVPPPAPDHERDEDDGADEADNAPCTD
jgi:hypothetical protein